MTKDESGLHIQQEVEFLTQEEHAAADLGTFDETDKDNSEVNE